MSFYRLILILSLVVSLPAQGAMAAAMMTKMPTNSSGAQTILVECHGTMVEIEVPVDCGWPNCNHGCSAAVLPIAMPTLTRAEARQLEPPAFLSEYINHILGVPERPPR